MALNDKNKSARGRPDESSKEEPVVLANIDELIIPADNDPPVPRKKESKQFMDFGDTPPEKEVPEKDSADDEKSFVTLDDFDELDFTDAEDFDDDDESQPDFEAYYLYRRSIPDEGDNPEPAQAPEPSPESESSDGAKALGGADEYYLTDSISFFDKDNDGLTSPDASKKEENAVVETAPETETAPPPEPESKDAAPVIPEDPETVETDASFQFGETFASKRPPRKEKSVWLRPVLYGVAALILMTLILSPGIQKLLSNLISRYAGEHSVPSDSPAKHPGKPGNNINPSDSGPNGADEARTVPESPDHEGIIEDPLNAALQLIPPLIERLDQRRANLEKLRHYYRNGVDHDASKIREWLKAKKIKTLQDAMNQTGTELTLRRISYRMHYLSEISRLVSALEKAREELLYIKRKSEIDAMFIPFSEEIREDRIIEEINNAVSRYRSLPDHLVIQNDSGGGLQVETVWNDIVNGMKSRDLKRNAGQDIKSEICSGEFSNIYALKRLTPEIAECLAAWKGKDMYLGEIRRLEPASAAMLAQWPGKWLILNGLEFLSPDTALQLAQWKGDRISLNGLNRISEQALNQLLTWKGGHLEMAGLTTVEGVSSKYEILRLLNRIVKWEGEGRFLYFSDRFLNRMNKVVQDASGSKQTGKKYVKFALNRFVNPGSAVSAIRDNQQGKG